MSIGDLVFYGMDPEVVGDVDAFITMVYLKPMESNTENDSIMYSLVRLVLQYG